MTNNLTIMKKLLLLLASVVLFASCSIVRSSVKTVPITNDVKAYTAATLQVDSQMVRQTYKPQHRVSKRLTLDEIVQNAVYIIIEKIGCDTMVQVRYSVIYNKKGRVKQIKICGFPAKYVNFREPTEADRENAKAYNTSIRIVQ